MADEKKGRWITSMGRRIFIEEGQTLKQALESQVAYASDKAKQKTANEPQKKIKDAKNLAWGSLSREENVANYFNGVPKNDQTTEGSIGRKFDEALTEEEKSAIRMYTNEEDNKTNFRAINKYARGGSAKATPAVKEAISRIDSAISKFELEEPIKVFRNVKSSWIKAVFGDMDLRSAVGMEIVDPGFTSTTCAPRRDSQFGPLGLSIEVPSGKGIGAYVANYSELDYEQEFLLARNTTLRVTDVDIVGKKVIGISLEVVKND